MDAMRRRALRTMVSAWVASQIPWALAQRVDADRAAFAALSAIICGRASLDAGLSQRLYEALVADDPAFPGSARELLAFIEQRKLDAAQLQGALDTDGPALAPIPRRIASAWFLGIVGDGERARCVAFEEALNASIVADVLAPPTYCYGPYGAWARKPT